jgi:glycosyltransferase involved in cell wall biosynthesis
LENKIILQITGMISTKYGAIERYFMNANNYCAEHGYKTILQYETMPWSRSYLDDLNRESARIVIKPLNKDTFASRLRNLHVLLSSIKPDIMHVHFVEPSIRLAAAILSRVNGVRRTICTVHNKPDWSKRRAGSITYNLYNYILPVSDSVGDSLIAGGVNRRRLHTHYLGIMGKRAKSSEMNAAIRGKYNIPSNAVLLATIAFDAPFKGLDILLAALSKIANSGRNIHWLSVGVDPADSRLPDLASSLGIADRVHWAGILDDGWSLLNAADIYVQPSRSSEGLPLAIMEAMAMAIPVLCTRISGNVEAVEDMRSGKVVEPDADSMAAGILWMAENRSHWEKMGAEGFKIYSDLFEGEKSVRNMVRKYYF